MNEIETVEKVNIEDKIYEVRGKPVMLDSDLAILYNCKNGTKEINQAVNRNKQKFPERYSWILTDDEESNLRSQFVTSSLKNNNYGGKRYNSRVFTEQGIAMLATILKSSTAIKTSMKIIDAFVSMRKFISTNLLEQRYINSLVLENHEDIKLLKESFDNFFKKEKINTIFFEGEIYDAYSKIIDILKNAKKVVIIIDAYADKTILDIVKNLNIKVTLICKTKTLLTKLDIDNYNKQYDNLKIIFNDDFHDRYFIIDDVILYHLGTSINHAGSKTFSINKIEDKELIDTLNNKVKSIMKGENT